MRQLSEIDMWNLRLGRKNAEQPRNSASTSAKENVAPQRPDKRLTLPDTDDESVSSVDDEATRKEKEAFLAQLGLRPTRTRPIVAPARLTIKAKRNKKTAKKN